MQSAEWVVAHLQALKLMGMTSRDIARCAGVNEATVHRLLAQEHATVFPATARAILAVRPSTSTWRERRAWVSPAGTVRRVQALMAIGHSGLAISARAGKHPEWATRLLSGISSRGFVEEATRAAVAEVYEVMSMEIPEGQYAARTRAAAARRGFVPPLAWDEDTIDDPTAGPAETTGSDVPGWVVDELAHLHDLGQSPTAALAALPHNRDALERQARRHDRPDLANWINQAA